MRAALICNPASGRGRGARLIPGARAAFASVGITDVRVTERAGDEAHLTCAALDEGCDTIAVLGGDGTWSKCAAALAEHGANARIAFLHGGTGNDFAKNLPAPAKDFSAMAKLVAEGGKEWRVDMGRVESGSRHDWFLNVAGFGFEVTVIERVARGGALGGPAVYLYSALRELFAYRGFNAGSPQFIKRQGRRLMMVFANGHHFGGAFHIAPGASVTDGLIDAIAIGNMSVPARLPLFAAVVRGTHLAHPLVQRVRIATADLTFEAPPAYDIDGEWRQAESANVRIRCVPGALRVLAGPAA